MFLVTSPQAARVFRPHPQRASRISGGKLSIVTQCSLDVLPNVDVSGYCSFAYSALAWERGILAKTLHRELVS
jgi:hypothetical protein